MEPNDAIYIHVKRYVRVLNFICLGSAHDGRREMSAGCVRPNAWTCVAQCHHSTLEF